ncbi:hypothetical protein, partial [Treponema sp.]|uniref:hypothetical protein n=1 Tax=Treponema sp. TaxID=166 RepID=UPI00298E7176
MTYRLSKKSRISSILLSLTLLLICASSTFLLLSTELKKTEASRSLIIICALIIFAATVYVIYTSIKDVRTFITLDKENGITYCDGIKTIQIKFKLVEQLNSTIGAFSYLTLKNEHLRHNLVNFSKFENKAEISSFLIDNVTDRFGRLKFKTEQMIKQEIDAE